MKADREEITHQWDCLGKELGASFIFPNPTRWGERLSLQRIVQKLECLIAAFQPVWWHRTSIESIVITTPNIVLKDTELGEFNIEVPFNAWGDREGDFLIEAVKPPRGGEKPPHPHVLHETLCTGEGTNMISACLKNYEFEGFFTTVLSILQTYNSNSAHHPLSEEEEEEDYEQECNECGSSYNSESFGCSCDRCGNPICDDCMISLCGGRCGINCASCASDPCQDCGESFCKQHQDAKLTQCSACESYFCSGCQEDRLDSCPKCSIHYCHNCDLIHSCKGCDLKACNDCMPIIKGECKDCQKQQKLADFAENVCDSQTSE